MATDALVDVSYRGFVLGKRLRLLQVGPRSAYVACDAPMPVGTELILTVDETLIIPAQVARVREADTKDGPAGMWLWTDPAEGRAQASPGTAASVPYRALSADPADARAQEWWNEHVTAADPLIPEPAGGRIRTEGPVAPPESRADEAPTQAPAESAQVTPEAPQTAMEAAIVDAAEPAAGAAAEAPDEGTLGAAAEALDEGTLGAAAEAPDEGTLDVPAEPLAESASDREPDGAFVTADAGDDAAAPPYENAGGAEPPEDSGYDAIAVEAGDDTGAEVSSGADASNSGRARRARGTEVMTAVELAEVLGTTPEAAAEAAAGVGDEGAADDGEPSERPRQARRTQVMTAVEVDELLQAGSVDEPSRPESPAKGKSRNKRRRRR